MCVGWNGCSPRAAMLIRSMACTGPETTPFTYSPARHNLRTLQVPGTLLPCKQWSRGGGARPHRAARHATSAVVACLLARSLTVTRCQPARLLAAKSHRTRTATARRGLAARRPRPARRATSLSTPPRPRSMDHLIVVVPTHAPRRLSTSPALL
jgi:hypothetical protein